MRKISSTLICVLGLLTSSMAQEKLPVNVTKSKIKWMGEYTFYFGGHEGTVNFTAGYFNKTGAKITGGTFTIDMNTLVSTDVKNKDAKLDLENHLKASDFFDVQKYPTASLTITKVEYFENNKFRMEADFTIKGITKSVNFRGSFDYERKMLTTKFKIDRRRWNVNYTSKLRDGAISDAIGFEVTIYIE